MRIYYLMTIDGDDFSAWSTNPYLMQLYKTIIDKYYNSQYTVGEAEVKDLLEFQKYLEIHSMVYYFGALCNMELISIKDELSDDIIPITRDLYLALVSHFIAYNELQKIQVDLYIHTNYAPKTAHQYLQPEYKNMVDDVTSIIYKTIYPTIKDLRKCRECDLFEELTEQPIINNSYIWEYINLYQLIKMYYMTHKMRSGIDLPFY